MPHNRQHQQYSISYYHHLLENELTFPKWQREDCWIPRFKEQLIIAILDGIDLPKIYIGDIKDSEDKYIIDGGHRSRAIKGFRDNAFCVHINGVKVYYDKEFTTSTRNNKSLSPEQKKAFDNYHLDIVVYIDISTNDCRHIFNILQNAQPMSIDDVINSHQSSLVDFARELIDTTIEGKTMKDHFETLKILLTKSPEKTSIMTKLIGWYTIMFPMVVGLDVDKEREDVSLLYLTKGNNNNSPCLQYVKNYNCELSTHTKKTFIELLTYIIKYITSVTISPSDLNTFIHAKVNHTKFSIIKFNNFLQQVANYETLNKVANSLHDKKEYSEAQKKHKEADNLNNIYNKDLHGWYHSKKHGGNNPSGMRKRYSIVKERCLD